MKISKTKVLILASGKGSTLERLLIEDSPHWELCGLLVSKPCGALGLAKSHELTAAVVPTTDEESFDQWDQKFTRKALTFKPDLVLLAGFLKKIGPHFLEAFPGKILNTHPSLLPKYGGKGMYGARIHQKVFANQDSETGVTIHQVDGEYDQGKVLKQIKIDISDCQSAEEIESRVKALEKDFLVQVLNDHCQKK